MRILSAILAFQLLGSLASASVPSASPRSNEAAIPDAVCPLPETEPLRIIEKSIIVDRAPEDVYAFWRDLTHVPEFMERVESVEIVDAELSRWNIKAPLGVHLHWTVQILSESAPHDLAWCTRDGARIRYQGRVELKSDTASGGTQATLRLKLRPPDPFIRVAMSLTGWNLETEVQMSLLRLKQRLERNPNYSNR